MAEFTHSTDSVTFRDQIKGTMSNKIQTSHVPLHPIKAVCPHCWAIEARDPSAVDTEVDIETGHRRHLTSGQWEDCALTARLQQGA